MERFESPDEKFERLITDEERRIMGMYALLEVNQPAPIVQIKRTP